MWTKTPEGHKLIQDLSKDIVSEIAPEEMDLFDEFSMKYFQNPIPPDLSTHQKDDPLGFGLEETLIAITPAATAVADIVINHLITEFIKITQTESAETLKRKIKTLLNPENKDKDDLTPLTKEQLENIRKLARKQAIKFGIKPDKAEKIADALLGSLALS